MQFLILICLMPSYLDAGGQDVYALNRLGSTFSNMVIGLQQNRMRQQQFLAQQAMEAARLQIERERQQSNELTAREERKKYGAETDYFKARTGSERLLGEAGGTLGDVLKGRAETDPTKNPDVYNFLTAIAAQQGGRIAAQNPATIGRQIPELMSLNDPIIRNLIATGSPQYMNVPAGGSLINLGQQQPGPVFSAPPRPAAARDPQQLQDESLRALGSVYGDLGRAHALRTPQGTNTLNALNAALAKYPGGAPQAALQVPKPGEVYKGYRFKGGDPSDKNSWEKMAQVSE